MEYPLAAIPIGHSTPAQTEHDWQGDVLRCLQQAIGKVTISFDLWSSRNMLALLGSSAHFLDMEGKYQSFLLALRKQERTYTGVNNAATVLEIIKEFRLDRMVFGLSTFRTTLTWR